MGQFGFFDADRRLAAITAKGDPLEVIARVVPFESFRAEIEAAVLTPVSEKRRPPANEFMRTKPLTRTGYCSDLVDQNGLRVVRLARPGNGRDAVHVNSARPARRAHKADRSRARFAREAEDNKSLPRSRPNNPCCSSRSGSPAAVRASKISRCCERHGRRRGTPNASHVSEDGITDTPDQAARPAISPHRARLRDRTRARARL